MLQENAPVGPDWGSASIRLTDAAHRKEYRAEIRLWEFAWFGTDKTRRRRLVFEVVVDEENPPRKDAFSSVGSRDLTLSRIRSFLPTNVL